MLLVVAGGAAPMPAGAADQDRWTIGRYTVALDASESDTGSRTILTISDGDKRVYRRRDANLWINPRGFFEETGADEDDQQPFRVGEDVLGLGAPTLVVQGFSGGAHCCFSVTVVILGDEVRALPTIKLEDVEFVQAKKVPGRDALVLETNDDTFAYWRAPFATSSAGRVILSFDKKAGRYAADAELMRAPPPSPADLEALGRKAHEAHQHEIDQGSDDVPPELTQPILDLVYSGHLAEARTFLDGAWAGTAAGRDDYWSDLTTCQLRLSPYWPAIAEMNGLEAEKPKGKCPRG
jgi:hypothetical protein